MICVTGIAIAILGPYWLLCGLWWKSRKFRVHLSTMIAMSLVSGVMLKYTVEVIRDFKPRGDDAVILVPIIIVMATISVIVLTLVAAFVESRY